MDETPLDVVGMKTRREVLGNAHVQKAEASNPALNEEFRELTTRYGWGEIRSRTELPRQTRSLLSVAHLVAPNRTEM
jgi:alkylhydroperoxidase/carboxymuconolactone decarboxylase family protein YurZ